MSKFDLIDDYLTNRLSERERGEFESGMNADPALKSEVERQRVVVEGIRKARANELKAMLNKVPVGGASLWSEWSILKIAATIGVAGVIGTGLYFFTKDSNPVIQNPPSADIPLDSLLPNEDSTEPVIEPKDEETQPEEKKETVTPQKRKSKSKQIESSSPKVEVTDPSEEMLSDEQGEESTESARLGISMSTIQVERDSQHKQYAFHYQFWEGKLFLYGPFDESLYEILEVHGTNHALFLFFKDNFYHLDESKEDVMPLAPIRDRSLTQKLKEFRSGK
jgi:hypothetical protein